MRNLVMVAAALAAVALAGCSHRPIGGNGDEVAGQLVGDDVLAKAGLRYHWTKPIGDLLEAGERIARLWQVDENLYCLTDRNRVVVIDAAVGTFKWSATLGNPNMQVFRPCHANGVFLPRKVAGVTELINETDDAGLEPIDIVCFNTLSRVSVFERKTGLQMRDIVMPFAANTGGATDGERFYVGSAKGSYNAIALREAVPAWSHSTDGMLSAAVEIFGETIYIAGQDRSVYAADTGDRRSRQWSRRIGGPVVGNVHVDGSGVFVPGADGRIYALALGTGDDLWSPYVCEGELLDAIQVSERSVFQRSRGGKFYALYKATGKLRWTSDSAKLVLAVLGGDVYCLDAHGNLVVINESIGQTKATLAMIGLSRFAANTTADAIYAASASGTVVCIRKLDTGPLRLEDLQ